MGREVFYGFVFRVVVCMVFGGVVGCGGQRSTTLNLEQSLLNKDATLERYELFYARAFEDSMYRVANLFEAIIMSKHINRKGLEGFDVDRSGEVRVRDRGVVVSGTLRNLYSAKRAEEANGIELYKWMEEVAKDEGWDSAEDFFRDLGSVDVMISRILSQAIESIFLYRSDSLVSRLWGVCGGCGGVYHWEGLDDFCVICGIGSYSFFCFESLR